MNIDACLQRINYRSSTAPTLDTLRSLQLAFVHNVPFENLDIHLGNQIVLSSDWVYQKIVQERRGGFCFECNALFYNMLSSLGFDLSYVAAIMQTETSMGLEFEHMALLVHLNKGDYLVDVGNGQSCLEPMLLDDDKVVSHENIEYKTGVLKDRKALYLRNENEDWKPRFSFSTIQRDLADYEELCALTQVAPESIFTQNRITTLARPEGRVTLVDRELEINTRGQIEKRTLQSAAEISEVLENIFGISLKSIPEHW
ncbi:MAG: arylamine N-acetyltransferase [Gammaproteobacteria bacterium]|nr:arylamine N-acetyltransferase [Gammaproteobacteria bacterium]